MQNMHLLKTIFGPRNVPIDRVQLHSVFCNYQQYHLLNKCTTSETHARYFFLIPGCLIIQNSINSPFDSNRCVCVLVCNCVWNMEMWSECMFYLLDVCSHCWILSTDSIEIERSCDRRASYSIEGSHILQDLKEISSESDSGLDPLPHRAPGKEAGIPLQPIKVPMVSLFPCKNVTSLPQINLNCFPNKF